MTTFEFIDMIKGSRDQALVVKDGDVYYEVQAVNDMPGYCLMTLGGQYAPPMPGMTTAAEKPNTTEEVIPGTEKTTEKK